MHQVLVKGKVTSQRVPKQKSENTNREKPNTAEVIQIRWNVSSLENKSTRTLYKSSLNQEMGQAAFADTEEEFISGHVCT